MLNIETSKRISILRDNTNTWRNNSPANCDIEELFEKHGQLFTYQQNYGIYGHNKQEVLDKIQNNLITDTSKINLSATLYFDKTSTFPRFKLQETDFTRCVKLDKADYIVIPKLSKGLRDNEVIAGQAYKFDYQDREVYCNSTMYHKYQCLHDIAESVPHTKFLVTNTKAEALFLLNLLTTYNKPLIYDTDLEQVISRDLEKLDEDNLSSLYDMLHSSDESSVELGCKLLATFDVHEVSLATSMLLFLTQDRWIPNKGSNATSFKSMLKTLGYPDYGYRYIDYVFHDHAIQSDKDRQLAKKLIEPWIRTQIEQVTNMKIEHCPFKIEIEIEIE